MHLNVGFFEIYRNNLPDKVLERNWEEQMLWIVPASTCELIYIIDAQYRYENNDTIKNEGCKMAKQ